VTRDGSLTARQAAILAFLNDCQATHGCPPTLREIGARFGITSTNGVHEHLQALERKGYITRRTNSSRGIRVLAPDALTREARSDRVELERARELLRSLYRAARDRSPHKLDAVAAAISHYFVAIGETP
jgi:SOS-response transcriptional repressor LexA